MDNKVRAIFQNENFVDITLYQYGHQACGALHRNGPVVYNHFLFHYVQKGKGILYSTDKSGNTNKYSLSAGQGFLMWPKQKNTYIADEYNPWSYAWVEFDGLRARELVTQSGLTYDEPVFIASNPESGQILEQEINWITTHSESALKLIGHFYLFLDALIEASPGKRQVQSGSLRNFYIRESLNYIQQHYTDTLTVDEIAAYCKINRNYLGRIFRGVLDTTPQEFIITFRVNKACEMLKTTDLAIGDISRMVGYPNQLNFSRTFKRVIGVSPQKWRKANCMI